MCMGIGERAQRKMGREGKEIVKECAGEAGYNENVLYKIPKELVRYI